jgi:hypothetical protein
MAKVPFSKLDVKLNSSEIVVNHETSKGENVQFEVKNYLPIKEKMELVSRIINQSTDDNGFYNPMRVKLYTTLEVVYAYTNLTFTPKQKEDPFKLYDLLVSTGLYDNITNHICREDLEELEESIWDTIKSIYDYKNSVMGILDDISTDYSNLNLDASEIHSKLADPENMALLRQVLDKLG